MFEQEKGFVLLGGGGVESWGGGGCGRLGRGGVWEVGEVRGEGVVVVG